MNQDTSQWNDPILLAMMKGIGQAESGNNPNPNPTRITQTEGSVGRFQYTKGRWDGDAKKYLNGVALDGKTPLNRYDDSHQQLLKYAEVKWKKDNGWTPEETIATHNTGDGNRYRWQNMKGTNDFGNKYDVPAYVNKVGNFYNQYKDEFKSRAGMSANIPNEIEAKDDPNSYYFNEEEKSYGDINLARQAAGSMAAPLQRLITTPLAYVGAAGEYLGDFFAGRESNFDQSLQNERTNLENNSLMPEYLITGQNSKPLDLSTLEGQKKIIGDLIQVGTLAYIPAKGALALTQAGKTAGITSKMLNVFNKTYTQGALGGLGVAMSEDYGAFGTAASVLGGAAGAAVLSKALPIIGKGTGKATNWAASKAGIETNFGLNEAERMASYKSKGQWDKAEAFAKTPEWNDYVKKEATPENIAKATQSMRDRFVANAPTSYVDLEPTLSDDAFKFFSQVHDDKISPKANGFYYTNTSNTQRALKEIEGDIAELNEQLARSISRNNTQFGSQIDINTFLNTLKNEIKDTSSRIGGTQLSREAIEQRINKEFYNKTKEGLFLKPQWKNQNEIFKNLHFLRKGLNNEFGNNTSNYLAGKVRDLIKSVPFTDAATQRYLKNLAAHGQIEDAIKIAKGFNGKKVSGRNVGLENSLSFLGSMMGGGGINPMSIGMFFAGKKMAEKISQNINKRSTEALLNGGILKSFNLGKEILEETFKAIKKGDAEALADLAERIKKNAANKKAKDAADFMRGMANAMSNKQKLLPEFATDIGQGNPVKTFYVTPEGIAKKGEFTQSQLRDIKQQTADALAGNKFAVKRSNEIIATMVNTPEAKLATLIDEPELLETISNLKTYKNGEEFINLIGAKLKVNNKLTKTQGTFTPKINEIQISNKVKDKEATLLNQAGKSIDYTALDKGLLSNLKESKTILNENKQFIVGNRIAKENPNYGTRELPNKVLKAFDEVRDKDKYLNSNKELFADGFAQFITDPKKMADEASGLYDYFENVFKIHPKLKDIASKMSRDQIKGLAVALGITGTILGTGTEVDAMNTNDINDKVDQRVVNENQKGNPVSKYNQKWYEGLQTIKPEAINKWTSLSNQAVKGTSVNAEEIIRLLLLESSLGLFRNPNPNIFQGKFGDITGLEKKTWEDFTKRNPELAKAANFNTIEGTLKASALVMADKKEKKNIEYSEPKKLKNGKTVFMKKTTKPSVMQNEQDTYTSYTGQTNPKEKAEKIARWKLADDYFDNIEEQKLQALNSED